MNPQLELQEFAVDQFLASAGLGRTILRLAKNQTLFRQGDSCTSLFYIQHGNVKLTILSEHGKEATVALLKAGDFVGEECVSTNQQVRSVSASAVTDCALLRVTTFEMKRVLREEHAMSTIFIAHLLLRTSRIQADLVDQLFNSTEKRLARTLLLLANFGNEGFDERLVPPITQETLAAMIGSTRSRVNLFLNRFRKLGYIEYNDRIRVNKALLQVVLHD